MKKIRFNKGATFEEVKNAWLSPADCKAPVFPLLYFNNSVSQEIRGFLELQHLVGDVDFSGYPTEKESFIIDSAGDLLTLDFNRFVFPSKVISRLSKDEIFQYLMPSLEYIKDDQMIKYILSENDISEIIYKMADKNSW